MGATFLNFSSDVPLPASSTTITTPNPNPYRFTVRTALSKGRFSALLVHYPDCTTYGGMKCMVVRDFEQGQKELDPHFRPVPEGQYKVFARFTPDDTGWKSATALVNALGVANLEKN